MLGKRNSAAICAWYQCSYNATGYCVTRYMNLGVFCSKKWPYACMCSKIGLIYTSSLKWPSNLYHYVLFKIYGISLTRYECMNIYATLFFFLSIFLMCIYIDLSKCYKPVVDKVWNIFEKKCGMYFKLFLWLNIIAVFSSNMMKSSEWIIILYFS